MRWDATKYKELVAKREAQLVALDEHSTAMHDVYNSDGWDTKPKLHEQYITMQARHGQMDLELRRTNAAIRDLELVRPRTETADDGSDILLRFMDQGYNGLEDGERRAHTELPDEATEDRSFRSFMRLLSTGRAEVLDMGDLPAFSSVTMAGSRAAHALTMGQIAPDTTGAPSVNPAVQVDVMPTVAERLKFFGGASRMCQQVDTPGDTRKKEWPQSDDLEMGEIHLPDPADLDGSGFRASATEQDWDLDVIEFPCYRTDSKYFDVSMETMEQLGINVEEFIRRKVIRRLGRIADHHYTNNATTGLLNVVSEGVQVTAPAAENNFDLTWQDLVNIQAQVNRAYRMRDGETGQGGFMPVGSGQIGYLITDKTEFRIKLMEDQRKRPIWLPATGSGLGVYPGTIFGFPYEVLGSAPPEAANKPMALFGNFAHYGIRRAGGPLLFRLVDSETIKKFAARYIGFAWTHSQPLTEQYGGKYEWASAIYAGETA